jgi:hypothetical protein
MINMLKQATGWMCLTKTKSAILASLIAGAMALPFLMPVQKAQADNDGSDRGANPHALLGTWIVQESIDPHTVPPGTPMNILNFMRLETYDAGGGLVASNNGPGAGQPPSQGNWVRTGQRQYAATELRLGFDAAHTFTGLNKIRTSLTLSESGDEFTASVQTDIFLPNGTLLSFHPAGTSHGTRVAIEPLN